MHVAPARFARCAHITQAVHGARKANMTNDKAPVNKLTSSKVNELHLARPLSRIGLNRGVLTWLYTRT